MTIVLERYPIPDKGSLKVSVEISAEIKISADEARRKVNGWLLNNLSYPLRTSPARWKKGAPL